MKIYKLKVIRINKYYLNVLTQNEEEGTIYIKEIAHYYINDLNDFFLIGDEVYGIDIGYFKGKRSFSLKKGHSFSDRKNFSETGGGFLGLKRNLQNLED